MIHDRFHIAQWKQVFALSDRIGGEYITSPYDIVVVEAIRERVLKGQHAGITAPTDVCILAKGEPTNRAVTKIGGLPYWPADRSWPYGAADNPMTFVAQFNFADSRDLTGPLPGDILVFFADEEAGASDGYIEEGGAYFAWFSLDHQCTLIDHMPETGWHIDPCYAVLYRTVDYPEVESDIFEAYSQPYLIPCLEATKIGGAPRWVQYDEDLPGRFLCALCSVQPSFQQPYPYVNVPAPIMDFSKLYGTKDLMIGDMGSYYLCIDDFGQVHVTGQCY
ncbi:MAG: DUF1963 domain-containing protein [Armatimonadota bacterium]